MPPTRTSLSHDLHERAADMKTRRIGFYGCSVDDGAVVRVAFRRIPERYPVKVVVDCSHCGERHLARVSWRKHDPIVDRGKRPLFLRKVDCR